MNLQVRIREVAARASSVSDVLSSDEGSLDVLGDLLTATREGNRGDGVAAAIQDIQQIAEAAHHAIQAIGPMVDTFYALGVMTRIESVRCKGAGAAFLDLADAVNRLSRQIREQIGATDESATILLNATSKAADEVRRVTQKYQENLAPLARQVGAQLAKIKEHRSRVAEATKRLAGRFDEVSRAVGDVVLALQSHDMVRQRIEHVLEALRQADCDAGPESNLPAIARLQAAQLNDSYVTFERSVRQVRDGLAGIERNIGEVSEESARSLGISGTRDESFLTGVESDLENILAILGSNRKADQRLAATATSVHRSVSEISQTIAGVRAIGIQMQHTALNSTIQAGRLGADGAALRIVAQTIGELARAAEGTYVMLGDRLSKMRDAAVELGKKTAERSDLEGQTIKLRQCIEALSSIQEQALGDYARTVELAGELREEIRGTVDAFGTQKEGLDVLGAAEKAMRKLSAGASVGNVGPMDRIASMYTMQSERVVHETMWNGAPQMGGLSEAGSAADSQEGNVEFF